MQSLYFWKNWPKDYRWLWYAVSAVFVFTVIFMWFGYLQGADGVIHWEKFQEQKIVETTVHEFRLGPFHLNVPGESYVILEYFNGSHIIPNNVASYLYLTLTIFCALLLLAVITRLPRFWYFIGMALFILFLVSLRFEVLSIAGFTNRIPIIIILILYLGPAFYFNQFHNSLSIAYRLVIFSVIAVGIGIAIHFFAEVDYPFNHLALTSYTGGMVISVLFIIMVAHEILASFVYVASQGGSKSLRHLSLISVVYMTNVIITCMHELGVIHWNFIYLNPYLLLTVSAVLGLWGFRQREAMYQNIFPFAPYGAYFFLALATVCFATIAQLLGNANDPASRVIRDAIIFSHTGYGIIFLTYIFSNFILMLARNLPVYKVLYNPTRMPYFTFRLAGMIAMLGFVFYSNWRTYVFHAVAGFYNNAGDLHTLLGNKAYAESFYEQGKVQAFQNHRSNYALATLKASRYNFEDAHTNYGYANARNPTPYSLVNAGNVYLWENNIFQAISSYHDALRRLPRSGPVKNNLGFGFSKVHNVDSALLYLNDARNYSISRGTAEANFLGLAALEFIPLKTDSLLEHFDLNPAVISNAIALSTLQKEKFTMPIDPLKEKYLDLFTATLLNNHIIKHATTLDTTFIREAYKIADDSVNVDYSEALKSSLAFAFYHRGNVAKALEVLAELAYISQQYQGKFNYIMGLWALEQGNPVLASTYFNFADTYTYKDAKFYNAIALSEAGRRAEALIQWDSVAQDTDETKNTIAAQMKKILSLNATDALSLNDVEKYQFCRYNIGLQDSLIFNRIINTFESADYKAQALLDLSKKYYEADLLVPAIKYYNRIAGLELTDKGLYDEVRHAELLMLSYRGELRLLANQINKDITFDDSRYLEKMLYTSLIAESSGDTTVAEKNFKILGSYNPYFVEGIISSANFYRRTNQDRLKPYSILAEAIQINANSVRLLKAYIAEASRVGFDDYVTSASLRLAEIQRSTR